MIPSRRGYQPMTEPALPDTAPAAAAECTASAVVPPDQIRAQLKRLIDSQFFRASKRCRLFLEHVVEHSLSDSPQALKERTLGVHVFGREPTYDTATDPVVRVTAGEVRRRLAQYYAEEAHHIHLRIDLPPGSYAPMYTWPHSVAFSHEEREPDIAVPVTVVRGKRWWVVGAIAGGAAWS